MNACSKYFLIILLMYPVVTLKAQHNFIYRNHQIHQVMVNPATAGSEFIPVAALSFQKQWLGIQHAPSTLLASTSLRLGNVDFYNPRMMINRSRIKTSERIGLGIGIYADRNGPLASRGLNMAYAYHIRLAGSSLSFGLSGTMEHTLRDGASWDPISSADPLLDPLRDSYYNFNANTGVFISGVQYFAGLAVNHLIPLENKLEPGAYIKPDYVLHGGYVFRVWKTIQFEPSLHLRYLDYTSLEYDIISKLYIQNIHWLALTYRSYKALAFAVGLKISQFYLAYQFEANLSGMASYNAGSHTIHLGMNLGMRGLKGF